MDESWCVLRGYGFQTFFKGESRSRRLDLHHNEEQRCFKIFHIESRVKDNRINISIAIYEYFTIEIFY